MKTDELILYRDFEYEDVFKDIVGLSELVAVWENKKTTAEKTSYVAGIIQTTLPKAAQALNNLISISTDYGFEGNLWHAFLTLCLIQSENAFSLGSEIRGDISGGLAKLAMHDIKIFSALFDFDFRKLDLMLDVNVFNIAHKFDRGYAYGKRLSRKMRDRILELSKKLAMAATDTAFYELILDFYKEFGVGKYGLHEAFYIDVDANGVASIEPVYQPVHVKLSDLVGYEIQKAQLKENTEAFIKGKGANNCLLYGDAGTGKSTSVKGIASKYYRSGLRIIQLYKHQFDCLNQIIAEIKNRHYKFIIFMDDLSFEDNETEYKYLKALIEGGLEKKPDNVVIYATSNRRHLIKETFKDKQDRDDELHTNDTVAEKLSLSARFGVTIFYGKPGKKDFNSIVLELARRNDIKLSDEEILAEANMWELSHGGMSGRAAQQFVENLMARK